jgi:hypothetical protein
MKETRINAPLCLCGCGQPVNTDNKYRNAVFIRGHNRKGVKTADNIREKISNSLSGIKFSEERRQNISRSLVKRIGENYFDRYLKYNYNISEKDYDNLFKNQNGVCAICHESEIIRKNGKYQKLSVDHDHKTGEVRGLLCRSCNSALGRLKDDLNRSYSVYKYLLKYKPVDYSI